ncbi:NACHT domain-containing NTPase [Chroococcus sp. FPU101]|uniref:NACHT domain-containing protein n=1 Tax=Chroococcus sp. FPU101 TaxID=1974212 RepID=UPI001A8C5CAE|nr:hypothetical protein [Chroococcus sp. FPU101]GFE69009.1 hypothetical protein CFPU101_16190 [Chroococcus sp. FPU101]
MSKYSFDRIEPKQFEAMCQALLEKTYRASGNLIQFGDGQDGGREATWTQPIEHQNYTRPVNEIENVPKEWVFQVKYHDISQRGWEKARDAIIDDLAKELNKIVNKHQVPCHAYVMITNVPFTGVRNVGTRDKITIIAEQWKQQIPEVYVWDAADISRMLDTNKDVRTAYLDSILPGDILKAIYQGINFQNDRKKSAFQTYLKFILDCEKSARAQEAGDEQNLPLLEVFIDFTLTLLNFESLLENSRNIKLNRNTSAIGLFSEQYSPFFPNDWSQVRASKALFLLDSDFTLFLGGPGLGKSTLTQFLSLYQAARIIEPDVALSLAKRLKLPQGIDTENLDSYVNPRFPFRVELRRYAKWMSEKFDNGCESYLALYIVEKLINENTSSNLGMDDIFGLASTDPILLILDGLDEVPNIETRQKIIENLRIFVNRVEAEKGDLQVILSSRPNGYSGEFDEFKPVTWKLNELERPDFDEYCEQWLKQRIPSAEERREAKERIEAGMESEAVQRLARSLLQATVILTIVRRKIQIPHQKHLLYKTYVEVIFAREKEKTPLVSKWENELLKLHERVGFELHRKMEQSRIQALNDQDFHYYIYDVLEDCPVTKFGTTTLGNIAQEIIEMATDRLCLLVGKGEKQTEIDFVLQQYREYFAASYLTNHPDADSDLVFFTLIKRGAYWSYVLQFYVAQAHPNQQMSWLNYVDDQDEIINKTIASRAILNILPEFKSTRPKDFERAFKSIFDKKIRWTWLEQESIIDILQVIRSGSAFTNVWKWLDDLSIEDQGNLETELWLLGRIHSLNTPFLPVKEFESKIQELLQQDQTKSSAILACFNNNLIIDLSFCNFSELELVFEKIYYTTRLTDYRTEKHKEFDNIISSQNPIKLCELLCCSFLGKFTTINLLSSESLELSLLQNSVKLRLNSYLTGKFLTKSDLEFLNLAQIETDNIYVNYLQNLIDATKNLTDSVLDQKTRDLEEKITDKYSLMSVWSTDNILGPSITAFSSIDDWQLFRQKLTKLLTDEQDWCTNSVDFNNLPHLWPVLFFHPNHWSLLVEKSLITEEEYQLLLKSSLALILQIPIIPIHLFNGGTISKHSTIIPLTKVLNVALTIAKNYGIEYLGDAKGLDAILWGATIEQITKEETESILYRAMELSPLPPIWSGTLLLLCLHTPLFNIDILVDFWEKNQELRIISVVDSHQNKNLDKSNLINQLLSKDNQSILPLVAAIIACGVSIDEDIQNKLYKRFLDELDNYLDNNNIINLFYLALLNLKPSLEEFVFWQNSEIIKKISELSYYFIKKICQRFLEISHPNYQLNYEKLREKLMIFIEERNDFPPELVLSVLEVILKMDEANLPELRDQDWQRT